MDDSSQLGAPEAIRAAVADRYSAIGVSPSSEETIPVGRAWAVRLGFLLKSWTLCRRLLSHHLPGSALHSLLHTQNLANASSTLAAAPVSIRYLLGSG